jgi:hypothetical protein
MREMRLDKLMKLREVNPMNTLKQISRCYSELCELFLVNLSVFKFRFVHVRPSSWMVFCIEEFVKHFQQVFRLKSKIRRKAGSTSGFPSLLNQIDALTSDASKSDMKAMKAFGFTLLFWKYLEM